MNPGAARPVSIIGCGSIGSFVAPTLAKMGFTHFHLYDGDKVGEENIGCQGFGWSDLGKSKVEALKTRLVAESPVQPDNVITHNEMVTDKTKLPFILTVLGLDSMAARKLVWDKLNGNVPYLVDGRIGGQVIRVFGVLPNYEYAAYYEKYLYDDEQAAELPCTRRNVSYVANLTAGLMGSMVREFATNGVTVKEYGWDVEHPASFYYKE